MSFYINCAGLKPGAIDKQARALAQFAKPKPLKRIASLLHYHYSSAAVFILWKTVLKRRSEEQGQRNIIRVPVNPRYSIIYFNFVIQGRKYPYLSYPSKSPGFISLLCKIRKGHLFRNATFSTSDVQCLTAGVSLTGYQSI